MQDIHVTDAVELERLWLIMYKHGLVLMSPLKDGLSFMDHVMEGVDAKSMNTPLDIKNVLIVRLMDVRSQKNIVQKYINLFV